MKKIFPAFRFAIAAIFATFILAPASCLLLSAFRLPPSAVCLLPSAFRLLPTAYCQFPTVATRPHAIHWSLKLDSDVKAVKPGEKFKVLLTAQIQEGWHLYSTSQPAGGPIPTRIALPAGQPFESAGKIEGPKPQATFDKNFGLKTEFYETSATFKIPVKVSAGTPAGKQKLQVTAFFQACSSTLCLAPVTEKLELFVNVAGLTKKSK